MEEMPQCKYSNAGKFGGGSCGSPHTPDCPLSKDYNPKEVISMADKSPRDKEKKKKKKEKKK